LGVSLKVEIIADIVYIGGRQPFVRKGDIVTLTKAFAHDLINRGLARPYKKTAEEE
jgi:hypothetical protein